MTRADELGILGCSWHWDSERYILRKSLIHCSVETNFLCQVITMNTLRIFAMKQWDGAHW